MEKFSKTQIDKLGDRLRKGQISEEDLKLLDEYRKSYGQAYDEVVNVVREKLKLNPAGRPAKSTSSIIDKLQRESIRLSQVQDIAGCRLVVKDVLHQDQVVDSLCRTFVSMTLVDRRVKPSHGYRAVHVVIKDSKLIEIQIRTEMQHQWAELSEKCSDKIDPMIKYGGGNQSVFKELEMISNLIHKYEDIERKPDISKEEQEYFRKEFIKLHETFMKRVDIYAEYMRMRGKKE